VVSISPSTTEALFAVGAGARVVGRSRYCDYPPEAARLPVVGGFVDLSLEAVLGLSPDLVVGARGPSAASVAERIEAMGIATYFPRTESMADIDTMIAELSTKVGMPHEGERLVVELRARRQAIAHAVAGLPRVRVLLVFGLRPIVVAGPHSFPDEMLRIVQAENVVTSGTPYPAVDVEHLLALDPELIVNAAALERRPGAAGNGIDLDAPGWRDLSAVKKGRVVPLEDEAALRPGPRIGDGLAALARGIHPGAAIP
jgi:iron complex transport system substrate-binding protein